MFPLSSVRVGGSTSARNNSRGRLKGAEFVVVRSPLGVGMDACAGGLLGALHKNDKDNSRAGLAAPGSDRERL
jgi:hypothetical protein